MQGSVGPGVRIDVSMWQKSETKNKEKGDEKDESGNPSTPLGGGGPVPDRGHKEYVQPGTDTLKDPPINTPPHLATDPVPESTISQPTHSFGLSFIMIIASEIGDKTFLIAALMAMKHPRIVVFTAALASLIVMSILSAILGHAVPTLIPKHMTAFLAGGLFLIFGVKMLKEGLEMEKGTGNVQNEMAEVEAELQEKSRDRSSSLSRKLESGTLRSHTIQRSTSSPSLSDSDEDDYASARGMNKGKKVGVLEGVQNLAGLLLSPAWVQTFVMTFLGEWGDRSQIATIAMAAGQDYWFVTIGAITGHTLCTGIAVIGGRMLASRISVRNGEFILSSSSSSSCYVILETDFAAIHSDVRRCCRVSCVWRVVPGGSAVCLS
jgi:putative Ca2+/H+ antiporter (TMEM165/GDT1 family)